MIYVVGTHKDGLGAEAPRHLASLLGINRETFLKQVLWLNLFDLAGTDPAKYIEMIDRASTPDDVIILLGRDVAGWYGMDLLGPLAVTRRHGGMGTTVVSFPQPSHLNRWWRRADHTQQATETLKRVWETNR